MVWVVGLMGVIAGCGVVAGSRVGGLMVAGCPVGWLAALVAGCTAWVVVVEVFEVHGGTMRTGLRLDNKADVSVLVKPGLISIVTHRVAASIIGIGQELTSLLTS